jgi:hypothetical protein
MHMSLVLNTFIQGKYIGIWFESVCSVLIKQIEYEREHAHIW